MVISLKKDSSQNENRKAIAKLEKQNKKPSLKKHFGSLKRGLDGLVYQREARS